MAAEETRSRLLEAAAEVFAERGYDGARISDIAGRAGLTAGAIYNHYKSKADLLLAAVEANSGHEIGRVLASDERIGVLDLLTMGGARLVAPDPQERGSLLVEAIVAARRDPKVARVLRKAVAGRRQVFTDLVSMSQAGDEVDGDVDPQVVAHFSLMLGLGSLLIEALDLPPVDRKSWSAFIARLVDGFRSRQEDTSA